MATPSPTMPTTLARSTAQKVSSARRDSPSPHAQFDPELWESINLMAYGKLGEEPSKAKGTPRTPRIPRPKRRRHQTGETTVYPQPQDQIAAQPLARRATVKEQPPDVTAKAPTRQIDPAILESARRIAYAKPSAEVKPGVAAKPKVLDVSATALPARYYHRDSYRQAAEYDPKWAKLLREKEEAGDKPNYAHMMAWTLARRDLAIGLGESISFMPSRERPQTKSEKAKENRRISKLPFASRQIAKVEAEVKRFFARGYNVRSVRDSQDWRADAFQDRLDFYLAKFSGLTTDEWRQHRKNREQYEINSDIGVLGDVIHSSLKAAGKGSIGLGSSMLDILISGGRLAGMDIPLTRESVEDWLEEGFPVNPNVSWARQTFAQGLPAGAVSMAMFALGGSAAPAFLYKLKGVAGHAGRAKALMAGTLGAAWGADTGYVTLLKRVDPSVLDVMFVMTAHTAMGFTEAFPLERWFSALNVLTKGKAARNVLSRIPNPLTNPAAWKSVGRGAALQGLVEGTQEFAQESVTTLVDGLTNDEGWVKSLTDALHAGVQGAVVGSILGSAMGSGAAGVVAWSEHKAVMESRNPEAANRMNMIEQYWLQRHIDGTVPEGTSPDAVAAWREYLDKRPQPAEQEAEQARSGYETAAAADVDVEAAEEEVDPMGGAVLLDQEEGIELPWSKEEVAPKGERYRVDQVSPSRGILGQARRTAKHLGLKFDVKEDENGNVTHAEITTSTGAVLKMVWTNEISLTALTKGGFKKEAERLGVEGWETMSQEDLVTAVNQELSNRGETRMARGVRLSGGAELQLSNGSTLTTEDAILISTSETGRTTVPHELIHAFVQDVLTPNEYNTLLARYKKELGPEHSTRDNEYIAEGLARDIARIEQEFEGRGLVRKLLDFLKGIIGMSAVENFEGKPYSAEQLISEMKSGEFFGRTERYGRTPGTAGQASQILEAQAAEPQPVGKSYVFMTEDIWGDRRFVESKGETMQKAHRNLMDSGVEGEEIAHAWYKRLGAGVAVDPDSGEDLAEAPTAEPQAVRKLTKPSDATRENAASDIGWVVGKTATSIADQIGKLGWTIEEKVAASGSQYITAGHPSGDEYVIRIADHTKTTTDPEGRYRGIDFNLVVMANGEISGWDEFSTDWEPVSSAEWRSQFGKEEEFDLTDLTYRDRRAYKASLKREADEEQPPTVEPQLVPEAVRANVVKTSDGYIFHRLDDGRWADNLDPDKQDLIFDNIEELLSDMAGGEVQGPAHLMTSHEYVMTRINADETAEGAAGLDEYLQSGTTPIIRRMREETSRDPFEGPERTDPFVPDDPIKAYQRAHQRAVEKAIQEGKPVPAEVLADYPDIAPTAEPQLVPDRTIRTGAAYLPGGRTDTPLYTNPSGGDTRQLLRQAQFGVLRGLYDADTGDTHVWDAATLTHGDAITNLDLPGDDPIRFTLNHDGEMEFGSTLGIGLTTKELLKAATKVKNSPFGKQFYTEGAVRGSGVGGIAYLRPKNFVRSPRPISRRQAEFEKEFGPEIEPQLVSDRKYMAAAKAGDTKTAQRMVDEAAKRAGYTDKYGHSTRSETFGAWRSAPEEWMSEEEVAVSAKPTDFIPRVRETESDLWGHYMSPRPPVIGPRTLWYWVNPENVFDPENPEHRRRLEESSEPDILGEGVWTPWDDGRIKIGYGSFGSSTQKFLKDLGFDGHYEWENPDYGHMKRENIDGKWVEVGPDNRLRTLVGYNPSRIKLADPITRDRAGNIIPLSQRFDPTSPSIEFQPATSLESGLSSFTVSIAGVRKLNLAASKGDRQAQLLLSYIASATLDHLMGGIASAKLAHKPAVGLYGGEFEASVNASVQFEEEDRPAVLAGLAQFARNFNQQEVHVQAPAADGTGVGDVYSDGSFNTVQYSIELTRPLSRDEAEKVIRKSGLYGATITDDSATAYYVGDPKDGKEIDKHTEQFNRLAAALGDKGGAIRRTSPRLWIYGDGSEGSISFDTIRGDLRPAKAEANPITQRLASFLIGREVKPRQPAKQMTQQQAELHTEISDAYEAMKLNNLGDARVRRAYEELAVELASQYSYANVKFELWSDKNTQPYQTSREMREDVLTNNHLFVLKTEPGSFGQEGQDFSDHPLVQDSGEVDVNGDAILVNDMLRGVHDFFAHTMSVAQFGALGEEAAWVNHMMMTKSPWARWALTTETRGQNSWVNFGPHAEHNRANPRDTIFAEQKADLLPIRFAKTGNAQIDTGMDEVGETPSSEAQPLTYDRNVGGADILRDASEREVRQLLNQSSRKLLRGIYDPQDKSMQWWDGLSGNHTFINRQLDTSDRAFSVQMDANGGVWVTGWVTGSTRAKDAAILRKSNVIAKLFGGKRTLVEKGEGWGGAIRIISTDMDEIAGAHAEAQLASFKVAPAEEIPRHIYEGDPPIAEAQVASILGDKERLKVTGTGTRGKIRLRDIAVALVKRHGQKYTTLDPNDRSPRAANIIRQHIFKDIRFAIAQPGNAGDWYSQRIQASLQVMSLAHPELAKDETSRSLYLTLAAILSNGAAVESSWKSADTVYSHWKETGEFTTRNPETGKEWNGTRGTTITKHLTFVQEQVGEDAHGIATFAEWLRSPTTVRKMLADTGKRVYGENIDTELYNAMWFGPKLGAFYSNMVGLGDQLTMDRWWSRTWNRYIGHLIISTPSDKKIDAAKYKLLQLIDSEPDAAELIDFDLEKLRTDEDYITQWADSVLNTAAREGYPRRADAISIANAWDGAVNGLQDAPRGGFERVWMREVMREAVRRINAGEIEGIEPGMTVADAQALLWYNEQQLYQKLGAPGGRTESIAFDEAAKRTILDQHPDITPEQVDGVLDRQQRFARPAGRVGYEAGPTAEPQVAEGAIRRTGEQAEQITRRLRVDGPSLEGDGRGFTAFFTDVTLGNRDKSDVTYATVLDTSGNFEFITEYNKHRGNFDDHIAKSIPGFGDLQAKVGDAIVKSLPDGGSVVDIGASEGSFIKAITALSDGKITTLGVDPNAAMAKHFREHSTVPGSTYAMQAFATDEGWTEDDGTAITPWRPTERYDIAHEAMVFQFISDTRAAQIAEMRRVLKPNGMAIIEEKVISDEVDAEWMTREQHKDKYKGKYFDPATLEKKRQDVLEGKLDVADKAEGMHGLMVSSEELERHLTGQFKHVIQMWDSTNFKGYVASDSRAVLDNFVKNLGDTNSEFSYVKTPLTVEAQPVKEPWQMTREEFEKGVDPEDPRGFPLAGETVSGLTVREEVPNMASIRATYEDYTILKGVREVSVTELEAPALKKGALAQDIKDSGEINPLIVAIDEGGLSILEGAHRMDAIRELGLESFPAVVVIDKAAHRVNVQKALSEGKPVPAEVLAGYPDLAPEPQLVSDREYMAAVKAGDMKTAQRMVDEAAERAGWDDETVYHGTSSGPYSVFQSRFGEYYFSNDEGTARTFGPRLVTARLRFSNPLIVDAEGADKYSIPHGGGTEVLDDLAGKAKYRLGHDALIVHDVVDAAELYADPSTVFVVFDPSQIKSADPIIRDDAGNVIPLSKRFDPTSPSIEAQPVPSDKPKRRKLSKKPRAESGVSDYDIDQIKEIIDKTVGSSESAMEKIDVLLPGVLNRPYKPSNEDIDSFFNIEDLLGDDKKYAGLLKKMHEAGKRVGRMSWLMGRRDQADSARQLAEYAMSAMPIEAIHRVLPAIAKAQTPAQSLAVLERINRIIDKANKRGLIEEFKKEAITAKKNLRDDKYAGKLRDLLDSFSIKKSRAETIKRAKAIIAHSKTVSVDLLGPDEINTERGKAEWANGGGHILDSAMAILKDSEKENIADMEVGQISEIIKAITLLVHLHTTEHTIKASQRKRKLGEFGDAANTESEDRLKKKPVGRDDPSFGQAPVSTWFRLGLMNMRTKVEWIAGKTGVVYETLVATPSRAAEAFSAKQQHYREEILSAARDLGITPEMFDKWSLPMFESSIDKIIFAGTRRRRALKKWLAKNAQRVNFDKGEVVDENGRHVDNLLLSPMERVELMLSYNDQRTRSQMLAGGTNKPERGGITLRDRANRPRYKLTNEAFLKIFEFSDSHDKRERQFASALWGSVNGELREDIDGIWLDMFGSTLTQGNRNYWMSRRDRNWKDVDADKEESQQRWMERQLDQQSSFLKRTGGSEPFIIGDALQSYFTYVNRVSAMVTKAPAARDARILLQSRYGRKWRDTVETRMPHGRRLLQDLNDTIADWRGVESPQSIDRDDWNRIIGIMIKRAHIGALGIRPNVIAYQLASLVTATNEVAGKYMNHGMLKVANLKLRKARQKEMIDNSPLYWARWSGVGHQILTADVRGMQLRQFYDLKGGIVEGVAMGGIKRGDAAVMHAIWEAVKAEGRDKGITDKKDLMAHARERFREVVEGTQPTWDPLSVAGFVRTSRKNPALYVGMLYMSQRSKNVNMGIDALFEFRDSEKTLSDYKKMVRKVTVPLLVSSAIISTIRVVYKALTGGGGDEEDEWQDYMAEVLGTTFGNVALAGDVMGGVIANVIEQTKQNPRANFDAFWKLESGSIIRKSIYDVSQAFTHASEAVVDIATSSKYESGEKKGEYKWKYSAGRMFETGVKGISILTGKPGTALLPLTKGGLGLPTLLPHRKRGRTYHYIRLASAIKSRDREKLLVAARALRKLGATRSQVASSLKSRGAYSESVANMFPGPTKKRKKVKFDIKGITKRTKAAPVITHRSRRERQPRRERGTMERSR